MGPATTRGTRRRASAAGTRSSRGKRLTFESLELRTLLSAGPLVISEFMAINTAGLQDEDGDFSDWLEIYNPTTSTVNLGGWYLTDNVDDPTQWQLPDVPLAAGDYKLIYASGKNRTDPAQNLHTNFSLDGEGEYLALVRPDGTTVSHAYDPFPAQVENVSYGVVQGSVTLLPEGSAASYHVPTSEDSALGTSWTAPEFDDLSWTGGNQVLITECGTGAIDYVEFQNVTGSRIDTTGWHLVVNKGTGAGANVNTFVVSPLLPDFLEPGEVSYFTDSQTYGHWFGGDIPFGTSGKGWAMLLDAANSVVDFIPWVYTAADVAGMSITVNGVTIHGADIWSGNTVPASVNSSTDTSAYRLGNLDHNSASDFVFQRPFVAPATTPTNLGIQNPDLVVPFGPNPANIATMGIGFSTAGAVFGAALQTDVLAKMYGVNTSLWTRIGFDTYDVASLDSLTLQMQYNDGFVAYLNGQEIARRNAPASPTWDSGATAARGVADTLIYENIDVSSHLNLLTQGANLLAVHGLNSPAGATDFFVRPVLVGGSNQDLRRFFSSATPGEPNTAGFLNFVADAKYSVDRGLYELPFPLTITCATPGATIRYTTNGTVPTLINGSTYTAPLTISTTTTLRVAAFKTGYQPTDVDTLTYIFPEKVATQVMPTGYPTSWGGAPAVDYEVDQEISKSATYQTQFLQGLEAIPTLSLVLPVEDIFGATGLYSNTMSDALEKETSAELIYPDGSKGFQIEAGLKIQGGASRDPSNSPKHSFSLRFRTQYGAGRLNYPLFGDSPVDSFDELQLRAMYNNAWIHWDPAQRVRGDLIRDQWERDALLEMGQDDAGRGDFVHLYINGLYWGVYNIHEMQKVAHYVEYNGGDETRLDALNAGEAVDGTATAWNNLQSQAAAAAADGNITLAEFQQLQQKLDMVNFIDFIIVNHYGENDDWDDHNWRAVGGGPDNVPFRLYAWDSERILEVATDNKIGVNLANKPSALFQNLRKSAEFRSMFADRVQKHLFNGGALTPERTAARWTARATELDLAVVGESARWGDYRRDVSVRGAADLYTRNNYWLPESQRLVSTYFPYRTANLIQQYKDASLFPTLAAPVFKVGGATMHGGQIMPTDPVTFTGTGTIYYTLDGSDPRLTGGGVAPGALVFVGSPLYLPQTTLIRVRAFSGGQWSALDEARFYVGDPAATANLAITELNYHPYDPTAAELAVNPNWIDDDFEFLELHNTSGTLVDLTGVKFTDGVVFDFADSSVIALGPDQHIVLVSNPAAFAARYGTEFNGIPIVVAGRYTGNLNNAGERLALADRFGAAIVDFSYDDSGGWPGRADGKGSSLELVNPQGNYQLDDNWRSSSEYGGSPGSAGLGPANSVVVNEALSYPVAPAVDAIELYNPTAGPIDIGGWYLSDSSGNLKKFRIPDDTILENDHYLVFDESDFNSGGGLGPNDFNLSGSNGDDVWLLEADADGKLLRFIDHVAFGPAIAGLSFGRWPNGAGDFVMMAETTLGSANGAPRVGAVVINEIHTDPPVKTELVEYVELYNRSDSPIDLGGWYFSKGISYTFAPGTVLPGRGYLLVSQSPTAVQAKFHVASLGPFEGTLANGGEKIELCDDYGIVQDEVDYGLGYPWPTVGDSPGYSMELINPLLDNNLGGSWRSSAGSPTSQETLVFAGSEWNYFKGTQEPSTTVGAWRQIGFNDSAWLSGTMPIGYDDNGAYQLSTVLGDMRGHYTTVYLRQEFEVAVPSAINSLLFESMYNDGINVWINGTRVAWANVSGENLAYTATATQTVSNEGEYLPFTIANPSSFLVSGTNVIAVQLLNVLSDSADLIFDGSLRTSTGGSAGVTPGRLNSVFAVNGPPQTRQVEHSPKQPRSGEDVTVTVKATDADGMGAVSLAYQLVNPGDYIEKSDLRYQTQWTSVPMYDDGTHGDAYPNDDIFTAVLPGSLQTNRRLVRYKITAADALGATVTAPYRDDPQPNFAYYVYDGVPTWTGADQPGVTSPVTYDFAQMDPVPVYQLITTRKDHQDAQYIPTATIGSSYGGNDYLWQGALVYDGEVYDHITYRARGGVWRYAMGKNMWKFDFNRGHYFQARDDYGNPYANKWDKLNFSALIQQGNFGQRGEQGLFEAAGFKLHNLAGVESPKTNYVHFRIVENANENGANQYSGDFQGLYLTVEQYDGQLLDEHGLPDGNLYKMEGGTGVLNNQGPTQPSNRSDLDAFMAAYSTTQTPQWWKDNFDLDSYYSYHAITVAIHDYDKGGGKNYFYYHDPVTNKWSIHTWDLDLTWTTTYSGFDDADPFRDRVLTIPEFALAYRNRVREIRDLLFNTEQVGMMLDEVAQFVYDPGVRSFVDADRAMWDYNPIMTSGYVNSSKANVRYYTNAYPNSSAGFAGMVAREKQYVVTRGSYMDSTILTDEASVPVEPTLSYLGPADYPVDGLRFQSSAFSSTSGGSFAAMKWRIAEVTDPTAPGFDPSEPRAYEITPTWESGEISVFDPVYTIPGDKLEPGKTYRVRVRMKDTSGRWSHWSEPIQLVAGSAKGLLVDDLRITEVMYHPTAPTAAEMAALPLQALERDDFEFIELQNTGRATYDLTGLQFNAGITYDFAASHVTTLAPGEFVLLVHNQAAFEARYGTGFSEILAGTYTGSLRDSGEQIRLIDEYGRTVMDFTYQDGGSFPGRADGHGSSLEVLDTAGDYSNGDNWRASSEYDGSPGAEGTGPRGDVLINEVLSDSVPPKVDAIELYNATGADIPIDGWYLSDSNSDYRLFQIPDDTTIHSGQYLVFDETDFNRFGGADPHDFALSSAGDDVYLLEADAQDKLLRFVDHVDFVAARSGESFGRWPDHSGGLYPMTDNSLGAPNSGPRVGPVILSEVQYNPGNMANASDLEFVEVYNPTGDAVDLTNWHISGVDFTFAAGTTLGPRATLVVVPFDPADPINFGKRDAFLAAYSLDAGFPLVGGYLGQLSDTGETIQLRRPVTPTAIEPYFLEDEVRYDDGTPWPAQADGSGSSLHRLGAGLWGDDPASWQAAPPSPGEVSIAAPAEVAGQHVFYNNSTFDNYEAGAGVADDQAIATDKQALLPGGTASFANYTSYSRGINGIMIDVRDLASTSLTAAADFRFKVGNTNDPAGWNDAPAPASITVRAGQNPGDTDRVTILWADNAIQNAWLQVSMLATAGTGLAEPYVFYFGNAIGEAGNQPGNAIVNATDEILARNFPHGAANPAAVDDPYDYNRDGLVNGTDQILARNNHTNPLNMLRWIAAPASDAVMSKAADAPAETPADPTIRLDWLYEFAQTNAKRAASKSDPAAEAVDKLLASYWQ